MSRLRGIVFLSLLALVVSGTCQARAWHLSDTSPTPILVLVSFDGWRWDYIDRYATPNLRALATRGARAERLIPSFPPLTFPNHYTIVTGLYPEHHGIVANTMRDPAIAERFTLSSETAKDPAWWGGEPLWVTAIRQGRRAATMFWPGSEAAIGGVRPTYWKPYDKSLSAADRVVQVLKWLALADPEIAIHSRNPSGRKRSCLLMSAMSQCGRMPMASAAMVRATRCTTSRE